jgi:hypothetical protein
MNTLHLKKKPIPDPSPKKQWTQLIGKRAELLTKPGHEITGFVEKYDAHVLTLTDTTVKRRDADEHERQKNPVHVACETIAVAIEI